MLPHDIPKSLSPLKFKTQQPRFKIFHLKKYFLNYIASYGQPHASPLLFYLYFTSITLYYDTNVFLFTCRFPVRDDRCHFKYFVKVAPSTIKPLNGPHLTKLNNKIINIIDYQKNIIWLIISQIILHKLVDTKWCVNLLHPGLYLTAYLSLLSVTGYHFLCQSTVTATH